MFNKKHLLLYYYKYKNTSYYSFLTLALLLGAILLLCLKVVFPQMQSWFSIGNEINATRKNIANINDNINYYSSLNEDDLMQKRILLTSALPTGKDYQGVLRTISASANSANLKMDDYSFSIGELSPKAAGSKVSYFTLNLNVTGSPANIIRFTKIIQSRFPLCEVSSIQMDRSASIIALNFYYKPMPTFTVTDSELLKHVSIKYNDLATRLTEWSENSAKVLGASVSALPKASSQKIRP